MLELPLTTCCWPVRQLSIYRLHAFHAVILYLASYQVFIHGSNIIYWYQVPGSTYLRGEVDVTGRVDEVDEERRLVDLHVVGLHGTVLGLGGGSGGVGGYLGLLRRLAGALGGLRLQLSAGHLYTCDTNETERRERNSTASEKLLY